MSQLLEALNAYTKESVLRGVQCRRSLVGPPLKPYYELHLDFWLLYKDGKIAILSELDARKHPNPDKARNYLIIRQIRIVQDPNVLYIEISKIDTGDKNPIGELEQSYSLDYCNPDLLEQFDKILAESIHLPDITGKPVGLASDAISKMTVKHSDLDKWTNMCKLLAECQ